jgi:hypothetical protein
LQLLSTAHIVVTIAAIDTSLFTGEVILIPDLSNLVDLLIS